MIITRRARLCNSGSVAVCTNSPIRPATTSSIIFALAVLLCVSASAQVEDIYRINEGTSDSHVEYKSVNLAPGKTMVLGDLMGPGKVTYFYYTDSGASGASTIPAWC